MVWPLINGPRRICSLNLGSALYFSSTSSFLLSCLVVSVHLPLDSAGPQITSLCSTSFCYNIDEMLEELYLLLNLLRWLNSCLCRLACGQIGSLLLYVASLKVAQPIDDVKWGLTVLWFFSLSNVLLSMFYEWETPGNQMSWYMGWREEALSESMKGARLGRLCE